MRRLFRTKASDPIPTPPLFLIPEIAEKILLQVPAIDVLTRCRGVCKTWRDLIDTASPDLRYYSTSGLMRPGPNATKFTPSRARPRGLPNREPHPQLLTPIAVAIISIFWKRLAKDGITVRSSPKVPLREWFRGLYTRWSERDRPPQQSRRRSSSSSSMNTFDEFLIVAILITLYYPTKVLYGGASYVKKHLGSVGWKKRAVQRLGVKLMKEFAPVWQKVMIFQPHEPEFSGVLIHAGTNCRSEGIEHWDRLKIPRYFNNLADAPKALMFPLVEAIYSGKLLIIPAEPSATSPRAAGIDLTYEFGRHGVRIDPYDKAPKESFIFEAHQPFAVTYKYTRLLEEDGFIWGVCNHTLWRSAHETSK